MQETEPTPTERREPVTPTPVAPVTHQPETPEPDKKRRKKSGKKSGIQEFFSTIGILITALGIALLIIAFVFRSYQVDGPSMNNTLHNADKLIIWKVPRTIARVTGNDYIPKRGDIIVFSQSGLSEFGQSDSKQLIKRVIGLPGERVTIQDGQYIVYNAANPKGFNPDTTLGYGKDIGATTGTADVTVGKDQLFVSGDNRPESLDSRAFGPISADKVIGKLVLRVFPINDAQAF